MPDSTHIRWGAKENFVAALSLLVSAPLEYGAVRAQALSNRFLVDATLELFDAALA